MTLGPIQIEFFSLMMIVCMYVYVCGFREMKNSHSNFNQSVQWQDAKCQKLILSWCVVYKFQLLCIIEIIQNIFSEKVSLIY